LGEAGRQELLTKGKRYLRCPRQLNARFPVPCLERYSSIERLEPYLESVLREVVLTPEIRQAAAVRLVGESARSHSSDRQETYASLQEIEALQEKLDRLTECYVAGSVSDEVFETLGAKLDTEMRRHKDRSSLANRPDDLQEANKRTIRFLEAI